MKYIIFSVDHRHERKEGSLQRSVGNNEQEAGSDKVLR